MKILLLTDGLFPFQIGGMQKHSSILVKELTKRSIPLTVIHPGGANFNESNLENEFGNFETTEFIKVDFPVLSKLPGHYIRANKIYSKLSYLKVSSRINEFDIIYAQGFTGYYFLKRAIKKKINSEVIVNLHGYGEFFLPPNFVTRLQYWMLQPIMLKLTRKADFVYSFGGKITELLKRIGLNENKILHHANGIPDDLIIEKPRKNITGKLIYIGRNERRKGVDELEEGFKLFSNNHSSFKLFFVGFEKHNTANIEYLGEIRDFTKLIEILDECDCLVLPSYAEGMPTVILEAMARGLTIIASNVGAINEMVCHNGIIIHEISASNIHDALDRLFSLSEDELFLMKKQSLEIVKSKFTWTKVIESKISDFKKIIGESK